MERVRGNKGRVYNEDVIILVPLADTEVEGGLLWMQIGGKRGDECGSAIDWLWHIV